VKRNGWNNSKGKSEEGGRRNRRKGKREPMREWRNRRKGKGAKKQRGAT